MNSAANKIIEEGLKLDPPERRRVAGTLLRSLGEAGLSDEALEAARTEVRAGLREGLAPLRQLLDSFEGAMGKAIQTSERLQKKRVAQYW